jgi:hypothetical protein
MAVGCEVTHSHTITYIYTGKIQTIYKDFTQNKQRVRNVYCSLVHFTYKQLTCRVLAKTIYWLEVSTRYFERTNFPNFTGSLNGKHCRIKCPSKAGSLFYNYKQCNSLVLFAIANADYTLISSL